MFIPDHKRGDDVFSGFIIGLLTGISLFAILVKAFQ